MRLHRGHAADQGAQSTGESKAGTLPLCPQVRKLFLMLHALNHAQVLLRGTAREMLVDIACLNSTGSVVAHLPAVRSLVKQLVVYTDTASKDI